MIRVLQAVHFFKWISEKNSLKKWTACSTLSDFSLFANMLCNMQFFLWNWPTLWFFQYSYVIRNLVKVLNNRTKFIFICALMLSDICSRFRRKSRDIHSVLFYFFQCIHWFCNQLVYIRFWSFLLDFVICLLQNWILFHDFFNNHYQSVVVAYSKHVSIFLR